MGVVEQTSGAVESQLSALEESYGSFSVNQRSVTVPTEQYERKRGRDGCEQVDLYIKVENDDSEALHVDEDGAAVLPSTETTIDTMLERAARTTVEETTGVDCRIEGIEAVTILGLRDGNDTDRETVYTLAVLFEASHASGETGPDADWQSFDPNDHPVYA